MKNAAMASILFLITITAYAQEPERFDNGNGKYGFKDAGGKEIAPLKYDMAYDFSEGLASVCIGGTLDDLMGDWVGGKWGFIDKTGKEIIALQYDFAESFSDGLAACRLNRKWGFIDKTGKVVIAFKYENAFSFSDGRAIVKQEGRDFFIDKMGIEVK